MTWEPVLIGIGLALILGLGALVVKLWLRGKREMPSAERSESPAENPERVWRGALESLELRLVRQLDTNSSLLQAQNLALSELSRAVSRIAVAGPEARRENSMTDSGQISIDRLRPLEPPGFSRGSSVQGDVEPSRALEDALRTPEFLEVVWPTLLDDFYSCERKVDRFLTEQGLREIEIKAYPPLRADNPNHWEFLWAVPRQRTPDSRSFLVPRYFGRYDASFHSHLFTLLGPVRDADTYFRELRRCAVLLSSDRLEGRIDEKQVLERGVVSVHPPRR